MLVQLGLILLPVNPGTFPKVRIIPAIVIRNSIQVTVIALFFVQRKFQGRFLGLAALIMLARELHFANNLRKEIDGLTMHNGLVGLSIATLLSLVT